MSIFDYQNFVNLLYVGGSKPKAFFLHFTHTHYPVEFDSRCEFRGDDLQWFSGSQNFEGAKDEARCAAKQFVAFVEQVETLGIMEQSMIVLKSDHGKPVSYARADSLESAVISGHPLWGLSRYAPFLAIKPRGTMKAGIELTLDGSPVLLDDLARTICDEAGIEYNCQDYPGYNLVRDSGDIPPNSEVTAFVVESDLSDYRYETHEGITFQRGSDILLSLYSALLRVGKIEETVTPSSH